MMPGELNGLQLMNRLQETRPDIRVLLISGYIEPGAAAAIMARGIPVLHKPFRQQELLDVVARALSTRSTRDDACNVVPLKRRSEPKRS